MSRMFPDMKFEEPTNLEHAQRLLDVERQFIKMNQDYTLEKYIRQSKQRIIKLEAIIARMQAEFVRGCQDLEKGPF